MSDLPRRAGAVLLALSLYGADAAAQLNPCPVVPSRHSEVVDEARALTESEHATLTQAIERHRRETGFEIAVLTVPTLCGVRIETFSREVARIWTMGNPGRDDGMLVVLATRDHLVEVWLGEAGRRTFPQHACGRSCSRRSFPSWAGDASGRGWSPESPRWRRRPAL
ncbi:TPM domain-containing protein [Ramlibacter terrae]|uniref:TPM domain-containing protein n=1 Tax=Ramlibacter terrae TaxID=2732511 RepID=A0ABX6P0N4_9BURK|nr:TPM domain-containing protein [Ramlibacter terrae]